MEGEVDKEVASQSYTVESTDGTYRRNRKDIISLPNAPQDASGDTSTPTTATTTTTARRCIIIDKIISAILENSVDRFLPQVQGSVVYSNIIYYFAAIIIIERLLELNSIRNILC